MFDKVNDSFVLKESPKIGSSANLQAIPGFRRYKPLSFAYVSMEAFCV